MLNAIADCVWGVVQSVAGSVWSFVKPILKIALPLTLIALAVMAVLVISGVSLGLESSNSETPKLANPDIPPVEFVYFDAPRAEAYLDQASGGTEKTIERKEQVTRTINATFSAGSNAQLGGSQAAQQDTVTSVTPEAADRFYTLLRQLRPNGGQIEYRSGKCVEEHGSTRDWLGTIDDVQPESDVLGEIRCIGDGNFIRVEKAQLLLPNSLRILPRLRTAKTVTRSLPAPGVPFYSPGQSPAQRRAEQSYIRSLGGNPRVLIVAKPHADPHASHVNFVVPVLYRGLTREPSLLTGPVTVVGVLVSASTASSYVDYPTVATFGESLVRAHRALRVDLGLCPPHSPSSAHRRRGRDSCVPTADVLAEIRSAVTVPPPVAVILPIAIYG